MNQNYSKLSISAHIGTRLGVDIVNNGEPLPNIIFLIHVLTFYWLVKFLNELEYNKGYCKTKLSVCLHVNTKSICLAVTANYGTIYVKSENEMQ